LTQGKGARVLQYATSPKLEPGVNLMPMRKLIFAVLLPIAVEAAVTVKDEGAGFALANGFLTAQVNKSSGDLTSLKVNGLELMGYGSGHHAGYWEQSPAKSAQLTAILTIEPAAMSLLKA
jgi:hypothetical protein